MTNDTNDNNPPEESAACIALSKNDSYVMSASGGKVSLFNMMTFKVCFLPASLEFISFLHPSLHYSFSMHVIEAFHVTQLAFSLFLRS